jgi:hypothetical protein
MFLLTYIIFFLNIAFILRVLAGIYDTEKDNKTDDILRDFIGKTKVEEEEPETYEDFGHEVPQNDSHEE